MQPHSVSLITTFLLVFAAAIGGGTLARVFKQPTILGYIAAGVFIGNLAYGVIDHATLRIIAEAGVTLLLFTLGVEFSFLRLKKVFRSIFVPAVLQILMTIGVFLGLSLGLGIALLPSLFMAAAFSLSSTAVVVKILSERGELETMPGEVATGWLVVQDMAVIPMMILLPTIVSVVQKPEMGAGGAIFSILGSILASGLTIVVVLVVGKQGIPRLLKAAAMVGSREILLITTVAVVFLSGVIFYATGLSAALGAFIAGLIIAETSQNHAIFAEVRPLRDLFAVVFFVTLGMTVSIPAVIAFLPTILVFMLAVICIKWFVVYGLLRLVGYHQKTAFLVGLSLTQVSEFGFVIAGVGTALGVMTPDHSTILVAVTFGSLLVSTPFVANGHGVYYWFTRNLGGMFPSVFPDRALEVPTPEQFPIEKHIVICGYGRVGKYVGRALEMAGVPFLVVDYNHQTVKLLRERGVNVVYGDPADHDVLDFAQVDLARAMVIAIPDRHTQELIIGHAQTLNRHIKIICRSHHEEDQARLKSLGVTTIIQPEFEAAVAVVERLLPEFGVTPEDVEGKISRLKIEHGMG
ncbi:MAG: cation:proton antiporter [Candidatus Gottesmanbacteria bacterium]|nr:cation:proton antiporter [Candidatus Gottesmanbacteria bacterium]